MALKRAVDDIMGEYETGNAKVAKRRGRPPKTETVVYVSPFSSVGSGLGALGSAAIPIAISVPKKSQKRKKKRTMSPEAREKIAAAQRARWAKQKKA